MGGFSRMNFGCYNYGELKYLKKILLCYWFYWVLVFLWWDCIFFFLRIIHGFFVCHSWTMMSSISLETMPFFFNLTPLENCWTFSKIVCVGFMGWRCAMFTRMSSKYTHIRPYYSNCDWDPSPLHLWKGPS